MKELRYIPIIFIISIILTVCFQFIFDTDPFMMAMIISGSIFVVYSQMLSQLKDIIENLKVKNDLLHEEIKKVNKVYEIPCYEIMMTNKVIESKSEWFQKYKKIIGNSFIELRSSQEQDRFEVTICDFF